MPDREKVIKGIRKCLSHKPCSENGCPYEDECAVEHLNDPLLRDAIAMLKEQEQIVRCKDCKWWDKKDDANYGYCHACKHGYYSDHWEIGIYRTYKGDWFCADGERKAGR